MKTEAEDNRTLAATMKLDTSRGERSPEMRPDTQRKTHILFMIDQLCEAGGAERALLRMIEGLPKDRFSCWLVTFKLDPEIAIFRQLPCPAYVFPLRRTYDLNAIRVARKIRTVIRSNKIDIVHTFHETSDLWGGLVAKVSGCPILVSSRRDMGILRSKKHDLSYPFINRFVDRVLAVSERVRRYCIQVDSLSPEKVLTLYNGIDTTAADSEFGGESCRQSLGIPDSVPVISTVGHVRRVKGVDVFINAAARVRQEFPEAVFLVAGGITDKNHFDELLQLSNALGMGDHIKWVGDRTDIYPILKSTTVFCLPSRSEGFSNALIEAMACGLPCVATDVGGNGEAIEDGVNGYLVPPEDIESLAARIIDILRSPAHGRELGCAARLTVDRKFTLNVMIRNLVATYGDLMVSKHV